MNQQYAENLISAMLSRILSAGFVWLIVAMFNPPLVSSLVWIIAILFAEMQVGYLSVNRIEKKVNKLK